MIIREILLLFFIVLSGIFPLSQPESGEMHPCADSERYFQECFTEMYRQNAEEEKYRINGNILDTFSRVLADPRSFCFPFDSLTMIGRIYSPDRLFRMFTWNIPLDDGRHEYFGFLQMRPLNDDSCHVYRLYDRSGKIGDPGSARLSHERWYGALCYKILRTEHEGRIMYPYLALDLNDRLSTKKIIDVLLFSEEGDPVFGSPVFETDDGLQNRVIFAYSARISMVMRYDSTLNMIVFNHLGPIKPSLRGNYTFYGPDLTYDGYAFIDGVWRKFSNVDYGRMK